jgi:hypothetical protein
MSAQEKFRSLAADVIDARGQVRAADAEIPEWLLPSYPARRVTRMPKR